MDNYPHPQNHDDPETSRKESSELVPIPEDEPQSPPLDIDERAHRETPSEPIELPSSSEESDFEEVSSFDIDDKIDAHQPLPNDEDYHNDDRMAPDPYDIDDEIDLTMPLPTGTTEEAIDDSSTDEELDVDTAPEPRTNRDVEASTADSDQDIRDDEDDRLRFEEDDLSTSTNTSPVYIGGPSDDDPINNESDFYPLSHGDNSVPEDPDSTDDTRDEPGTDTNDSGSSDPNTGAGKTAAPIAPEGETICPVCGRQTDALHFCGYCGARLTRKQHELTATSLVGRLQERAGMLLEPIAHWTRPGAVRFIMALGAVLVLLALLANSGALALMFGAAILPLVLVFWCMNHDVFESESPLVIAGFGLGGTLVGAILGWLGSLVFTNSWFDTGVLNFGAAGFGGEFAERADSPPFVVWTLVGIVFPLLALAAIIGGPLLMRQTISLRNEVMDGLTLGAVMGAGFSIGTAIVFAAPMLTHGGPVADASTWTLTTIGLTIIRPLVWTLIGGMLGAATWRYLLTGRIGSALVPAIVGAAAPLFFTLMSVELSPTGLWPEIIWGVVVVAIVGFFYKRTLDQAIEHDRKILGNDNSRIICPVCHQVTPAGQFCANCGSGLPVSAGASGVE